MGRSFFASALAGVALLLVAVSPGFATDATMGEFGGECVMGLALGQDIQTDCSVNMVYKGKTYCFGNETARMLFLKRPEDFVLQAHIHHSTRWA